MFKKNQLKLWGWKRGLRLKDVAEIIGLNYSMTGQVSAGWKQLKPDVEKQVRARMKAYDEEKKSKRAAA